MSTKLHACVGCLLFGRHPSSGLHPSGSLYHPATFGEDTTTGNIVGIDCSTCRVYLDLVVGERAWANIDKDGWLGPTTSGRLQRVLAQLVSAYARVRQIPDFVRPHAIAHDVHFCGDQLPFSAVETGPGRCDKCGASWRRMMTPVDQLPVRCIACGAELGQA